MGRSRYDVLFIDFYGTIVTGDRHAVEQTSARVVADHRLPLTAPQLAERWGRIFFSAIERCNHDGFLTLFDCECLTLCDAVAPWIADLDPRPYARMLKDYWSDPPLAPGAAEALAALDLPVCVVSNADTEDVWQAIARRNLPIRHVVTSEDTRSYKPDSAIFQRALQVMGASPDRILHVGDSLHSDVGGARPLGIATCWICYEDRILDVGTEHADHKIHNLKELKQVLSA